MREVTDQPPRSGGRSLAREVDAFIRTALEEVGCDAPRGAWLQLAAAAMREHDVLTSEEVVEAFGARALRASGEVRADLLLYRCDETGVRLRHRLFLEYLCALALCSDWWPSEATGDVRISPLTRALIHDIEQDREGFGLAPRAPLAQDGYVPAGTYVIGSPDAPRVRRVIHGFALERDVVTAAELASFLSDVNGCRIPEFEHPLQPSDYRHEVREQKLRQPDLYSDQEFRDFPATCVAWFTAYAFARWSGRRLPTSAEWEIAARGPDGRMFSWGEKADRTLANCADYWAGTTLETYEDWKSAFDSGVVARGHALPTREFPVNVSPVGCLGMSGNTWEMTATTDEVAGRAVICGGSYDNPLKAVRAAQKGVMASLGASNAVGFRCVRDG